MNYRRITLDTIPSLHFSKTDVLTAMHDRKEREHLLVNATAYTIAEHEDVELVVQLDSGENIEVVSNLIEYEGDHVELRGGYTIPLRAILKVAM